MGVLIGVPLRNDKESFAQMILSLIHSTNCYEKIVVIESESTDGSAELCENLSKNLRLEIIHTKKEGPLKAYNNLFKIAKERKCDLLLTQSDVVFPSLYKRDWLFMMSKIAEKPECSMVTCINGGGISGPEYIKDLKWVGGWCTYIPYRTIEKLGGYDENFPNGYGVDIDYTYSASKIGHIYCINYWVDHHQMNTREHDNDPNTQEMQKESAKYFRKKWGLDVLD